MFEGLWYNTPATKWTEALPVGNGRIGAVVISDPNQEIWSFNEVTFWSGQSEPSPNVHGGKSAINEIQTRYHEGDFSGGKALAEQYLRPPKQNYGTNLTVATIHLEFDQITGHKNFTRELSLDEGIASTSYMLEGHKYRRETFVSNPHQIFVSRLSTDAPQGISAELSISSDNPNFTVRSVGNSLKFKAHALESIHSDGICGVEGQGTIQICTTGGSIQNTKASLLVKNSQSLIIFTAFNTDYEQANLDLSCLAMKQVQNAQSPSYEELKSDHMRDHQRLYRRVTIDLGENKTSKLPTNERQSKFKGSNYDDSSLFALYFQYGRYLTIAGSRADSPLPLHLQGLWNDGEANKMNWSCDYHLDINTQMNYFPTEISNLSECHAPLMKYVEKLAQGGKTTAKQFYGSPGWVAHVFSNAWGFTDPGWETGWGLNVTGGLWIASHMIEHFEYSLDKQFLIDQAMPILKRSADFYLDYMTTEPFTGRFVTGPSVSPENSFFTKDGEQQLSLGPTLDITLVRELFNFVLKHAGEPNTDVKSIARLKDGLALLPPFKVGSKGQLQEWMEDFEESQPDHRHLSHTMALCRSDQITPRNTPALAQAVEVSLANRQAASDLEDIEFTAALFALNFARLNDSESALKQVGHLIGDICFDNLLSFSKAGVAGAQNSIFVIDGNLGGTAAIAEMLLRSSNDEIDILPALPQRWSTGSVQGLRARGNLEIDIEWKDGNLISCLLRPFSSGNVRLYYRSHRIDLAYSSKELYRFGASLESILDH